MVLPVGEGKTDRWLAPGQSDILAESFAVVEEVPFIFVFHVCYIRGFVTQNATP